MLRKDRVGSVKILIVEENPDLGSIWQRHLERQGATVTRVSTPSDALAQLRRDSADVIIVNLDQPNEGAMTVADYAAYRHPSARVVFLTARSFFSDGSIFDMSPNACAFLPSATKPEDLATIVTHHAERIAKH
ncbi:response regulator [uncultured Maritimibacter sp.]|jgi:DNA-binding NtrC family response regulator|uniref:response regulator n=1 Tax=uncultured Maritimibacter sp. TaxID=991866 RepID=UPI00345DA55F